MLLAGIGLMGATQDAMTGFPVTASARLLDAMMDTAGIIAGVAAGLTFGDLLGVGLEQLQTRCGRPRGGGGHRVRGRPRRGGLRVRVVRARCGPWWPWHWSAALGQAVLLGVDSADARPGLGLGRRRRHHRCRLLPRRRSLPGPTARGGGSRDRASPAGTGHLPRSRPLRRAARTACSRWPPRSATAFALAAGVILGQYLAQPLKREAHRLETRLSGPRMVGPFRRSGKTAR